MDGTATAGRWTGSACLPTCAPPAAGTPAVSMLFCVHGCLWVRLTVTPGAGSPAARHVEIRQRWPTHADTLGRPARRGGLNPEATTGMQQFVLLCDSSHPQLQWVAPPRPRAARLCLNWGRQYWACCYRRPEGPRRCVVPNPSCASFCRGARAGRSRSSQVQQASRNRETQPLPRPHVAAA